MLDTAVPFLIEILASLLAGACLLRAYVNHQGIGLTGPLGRFIAALTDWAVLPLRRVLPNVTPVVGAQSTLNFGYVLAELAGLSFLGLGVQAPQADWGAMINEAQVGLLSAHYLPALVPAVAVVLVVVAVNILGEEFADRIGGGRAA